MNSAISMALGCSIVGAVDPKEVLRLTEKLFEAGVDMVAIADTVGYAGPKQVGELTAGGGRRSRAAKPICIHLHDTRGMGIAECLRRARCGRARAGWIARRSRRLPVCAGATGNVVSRTWCSCARARVLQDGHRYREAGRGARDTEIGNAGRGAVWRIGARRVAARDGGVI